MKARERDLKVVAINDLGAVETNAHLLRRDSVHGPFPGTIKAYKDAIDIGAGRINVLAERDPASLPWDKLKIDVALWNAQGCSRTRTRRPSTWRPVPNASSYRRPRAAWISRSCTGSTIASCARAIR